MTPKKTQAGTPSAAAVMELSAYARRSWAESDRVDDSDQDTKEDCDRLRLLSHHQRVARR